MFNLYTSYFNSDNPKRQEEIDRCLQKNIQLDLIKRIYLLIEDPELIINLNNKFDCKKIRFILIKGRPIYNTFFELMRKYSKPEEWNAIANSDIYFDDTLFFLDKYKSNQCLALTRWEVKESRIEFLNRWDSQDVWIVKGKPLYVDGDFELGRAGCDNAIAERFYRVGYDVINPSRTIKTYHVHASNHRTYNPNERVAQPYKLLTPTI